MIYLILKMFVYLLVALGLGAAAGWLWRNREAVAREDRLERLLVDARSRVPQMDTTLRARDDRIAVLERELAARDEALEEQARQLAERDSALESLKRTAPPIPVRGVSGARSAPIDSDTPDDELTLHSGDPNDSTPLPVPRDLANSEDSLTDDDPASRAGAELAARLEETRRQLDDRQRELAAEQRKVAELTRERELQARSLRALEQQLEFAREEAGTAPAAAPPEDHPVEDCASARRSASG